MSSNFPLIVSLEWHIQTAVYLVKSSTSAQFTEVKGQGHHYHYVIARQRKFWRSHSHATGQETYPLPASIAVVICTEKTEFGIMLIHFIIAFLNCCR